MRAEAGMVVCVCVVACGGEVTHAPEPVHAGTGVYELTIDARSDDCMPPLVVGYWGEVVVSVVAPRADGSGGGANIPLPFGPWPNASRNDVGFDSSIDVELQSSFCSVKTDRLNLTVLSEDGNGLKIEMLWQRQGSSACPAELGLKDCGSDRVLHFRWLRACVAETVTAEGPSATLCSAP